MKKGILILIIIGICMGRVMRIPTNNPPHYSKQCKIDK
jgi:hypothetical protein